jgi:hypothetical protein
MLGALVLDAIELRSARSELARLRDTLDRHAAAGPARAAGR